LLARNLNRALKQRWASAGLESRLQQQLAFEPMNLRLMLTVFILVGRGQSFRQRAGGKQALLIITAAATTSRRRSNISGGRASRQRSGRPMLMEFSEKPP